MLKKKETKLTDVLQNYSDVLADEVKSSIEKSQKDSLTEFSKEYHQLRNRLAKLQEKHVHELAKKLAPPPIPPRAMIPVDKPNPADESIRKAGQFNRKGKSVPRGFLQVLSNSEFAIDKKQSGRLELAKWLTDADKGAGNLTARVLANRIWHQMMGQGIVKTVDNFGRKGETPSHPDLLDYLANRLIETNWSVKHLVREIALSHTFRQSSEHNQAADSIDPDNRLLWRANRIRLNPEAYRDSVLFAADLLDSRPLKSSVHYLGDQATAVGANKNRRRTDFPNRSVYLPVIRNDLPEIFEAFDFADTHRTTGARPQTTVATTGLFILNDKLMSQTSRSFAKKILSLPGRSDADLTRVVFRTILLEDPTEVEVTQFLEYVKNVETISLKEMNSAARIHKTPEKSKVKASKDKKTSATQKTIRRDKRPEIDENNKVELEAKIRAWSTACHALFASSRFQILE